MVVAVPGDRRARAAPAVTADVMSWLTATLDEVEREAGARAALIPSLSALAGSHTPVVLAGVEADRAILALHEQVPGEHQYRGRPAADSADPRGCCICDELDGIIISGGPCRTVLLVAFRYRHRPGWREECKP